MKSPRKKIVFVKSALSCSPRANFVGPSMFLFEGKKYPYSDPPNRFQIMDVIVINSHGCTGRFGFLVSIRYFLLRIVRITVCVCIYVYTPLVIQASLFRNFDRNKIGSSLSIVYQKYFNGIIYHHSLCVCHSEYQLLHS